MKNTKRILEVKIIRITDTDPDSSYLGEYANKPDSEYSIDRATDEFQGDIDAGRDKLQRIEEYLDDQYNEALAGSEYADNDYADVLQDTRDTISDASREFDDVSWNSREFRYFNPNIENYKGEPDQDIRKYCRQDYTRMEELNKGYWYYMGVYTTAQVSLKYQVNKGCVAGHEVYTELLQTIRSGGLWGTESDSDRDHIESIGKEELSDLRSQLKILGFSTRAISTAFKNVKEGMNKMDYTVKMDKDGQGRRSLMWMKRTPKRCQDYKRYCRESRSESMDDHWRVLHALPGDGQNRPSVGDSLVQVQERYNVLSNMQAETYEYGIPPIYADPQVLIAANSERENS